MAESLIGGAAMQFDATHGPVSGTAGTVDRATADLAAVISRALEALAAAGRTRGHRIKVETRPVWLEGDSTRLEQVVTNLVANALKYTPPGGLIIITAREESQTATVRVEDTGIGIAPDLLTRIFDCFTQGEQGQAKGGLGIGLSLVKRLVELHGGTVDAQSDGPGRGSAFTVRLPLARPPAVGRDPTGAPEIARSRRVLVAEDQPDAREMLRLALEMAGHEVVEAASGPGALAAADRDRPEIALIDLGLPGLDGYEVARALRETPHGRSMFLVSMTGNGLADARTRALAGGFDVHVIKPVDLDALDRLVTRPVRSRAGEVTTPLVAS